MNSHPQHIILIGLTAFRNLAIEYFWFIFLQKYMNILYAFFLFAKLTERFWLHCCSNEVLNLTITIFVLQVPVWKTTTSLYQRFILDFIFANLLHSFVHFQVIPKNYEKIEELGKGAFGTVYKCRDLTTLRIFAMKETDMQKLEVFRYFCLLSVDAYVKGHQSKINQLGDM